MRFGRTGRELASDLPSLRLLKIDVEGMERDVLQGSAALIAKHRPLLYVENDRLEKSRALIEWIMAAGYRLWWHFPALYNPENHFGVRENVYPGKYFGIRENALPSVTSVNMLCQPAESALPVSGGGLIEVTDVDSHPLRWR